MLNKASYGLARLGLVKTIAGSAAKLKLQPKVTSKEVRSVLDTEKTVYSISPSLFPRPPYWPEHVKVLGYHERNKAIRWEPDQSLLDFIARYPKFLLITFGSMSNPNPAEKTDIILKLLEQTGIPAIINTAGGGLVEPEDYNRKQVHFIKSIPYDWIFPKTYAVVHHGGSGTTHMAMKYGCACMIIPHIIDQFLWNNRVRKLGVGPKGPAITALSVSGLREKLTDLWQNPSYKSAAEQIASQMAREDFRGELVETIVGKD